MKNQIIALLGEKKTASETYDLLVPKKNDNVTPATEGNEDFYSIFSKKDGSVDISGTATRPKGPATEFFQHQLITIEPYLQNIMGIDKNFMDMKVVSNIIDKINAYLTKQGDERENLKSNFVNIFKARIAILKDNMSNVTIDFSRAQMAPESQFQHPYDPTTFRTEFLTGNLPVPRERLPLSAINAVILRNLNNRTTRHQMKFHLVNTINEVSALSLEKYRTKLPAFIRMFENLIKKSSFYRQLISKYLEDVDAFKRDTKSPSIENNVQPYRYVQGDHEQPHMIIYNIDATNSAITPSDTLRILDNVIEGCRALINDAKRVLSEIDTLDNATPIFFDTKKNFSKNYYETTQRLPCMPFSMMNSMFNTKAREDFQLIPSGSATIESTTTNKFLYGSRLIFTEKGDLPLSQFKYVKQISDTFNGYIHTNNGIQDTQLEEFIKVNTKLLRYLADVHYFGTSFSEPTYKISTNDAPLLKTYESSEGMTSSISIVESTNPLDSKKKIGKFLNISNSISVANGTQALVANLSDLNIVPINIHALMREIPLIHIYNYAFVFEDIIQSDEEYGLNMKLTENAKRLLIDPYSSFVYKTNTSSSGTAELKPHYYKDSPLEIKKDDINILLKNVFASNNKNLRFASKHITVTHSTSMTLIISKIIEEIEKAFSNTNGSQVYDGANLYKNKDMITNKDVIKSHIENIEKYVKEIIDSKNPIYTDVETAIKAAKTAYDDLDVNATKKANSKESATALAKAMFKNTGSTSLKQVLEKQIKDDFADEPTFNAASALFNAKLTRNILFLIQVQNAIQQKIKTELEFINTKVVTNYKTISDAIVNEDDAKHFTFEF